MDSLKTTIVSTMTKVNKTIHANGALHHKVNVTRRLLMGAIPRLYDN